MIPKSQAHCNAALRGAHKNWAALPWGKGSSREKVNTIIPVYFCVVSVMFLPVCGSCAGDCALELTGL